ncbi:MAG: OprO/OprP family phosphate-selective porin [Acidobacteriia bacterium]|nr:OprO/OprP family phosphate-selective porin [Terriglobia bacterium]
MKFHIRSSASPARSVPAALAVLVLVGASCVAQAQVTPAAGSTPPDDTPSVKVGGTLFVDYTYQSEPKATNAAGTYNPSTFEVGRAYINIIGDINHLFSYRITPDIKQENTATADIKGSYVVRMKYAFGQLNLDDWLVKGSWVRLGLQQTPYIDFQEGIYRYRFQGPIFVDREGYLTSSDSGLSSRFTFPGNYGDVHFGYYNGDGYSKAEANNEKAVQIRASLRPAPMAPGVKGLRITAFYDKDAPISGGARDRLVGDVTFEHSRVNAGLEVLDAKDQASSVDAEVKSSGWSAWATPRLPHGWEILLRYDDLKPNKDTDETKKRTVAGVAYWPKVLKGVSTAFLLDYEQVKYDGYPTTNPADEKRYALHALFNF